MRLRFVRSARVGLVVAVAACGQAAPPTGSFDHLFAPPEGRFQHVSSTDTSGGNHDFVEIPAGDSAVLLDTSGPGIVRRLWVTVASRDRQYLRRIALKMYWEGETNPSVRSEERRVGKECGSRGATC